MSGDELRRIRKRLKLTQAELAARLGVHWNSVARWERGEISISESTAKLARFTAAAALAKAPTTAKR